MDIKNLFKSVLSKFKKDNAESAGQKLDEGKISVLIYEGEKGDNNTGQ